MQLERPPGYTSVQYFDRVVLKSALVIVVPVLLTCVDMVITSPTSVPLQGIHGIHTKSGVGFIMGESKVAMWLVTRLTSV